MKKNENADSMNGEDLMGPVQFFIMKHLQKKGRRGQKLVYIYTQEHE